MSDFNRTEAERMIRRAEGADTDADAAGLAGIATARALLAVEERLAQLIEYTRLGLVINAKVTSAFVPTDAERSQMGAWIRGQVTEIVSRS